MSEQTWVRETDMPLEIYRSQMVTYEDKLYLFGGQIKGDTMTPLARLQIYDTVEKAWKQGSALPKKRIYHSAIRVGHIVYIMGGRDMHTNPTTNTIVTDIYDLNTGEWSNGPQLPRPRHGHCAAHINGKIYLFGGSRVLNAAVGTSEPVLQVDVLDVATGIWSQAAPLNVHRLYFSSAALEESIYAFSGIHADAKESFEIYDINTDSWTLQDTLPDSHSDGQTAVPIGHQVYLIGGGRPAHNIVDILDTRMGTYSDGPNMQKTVRHHTSEFCNGSVYVCGGLEGEGADITKTVYSLRVAPVPSSLHILLSSEDTAQLSLTPRLADNADYSWQTEDAAVANPDEMGLVTAGDEGATAVSAANGEFEESVAVKVENGPPQLALHLNVGQSQRCWFSDEEGVIWQTEDESIATVSPAGTVTGTGRGLTTVTATLGEESQQLRVRVR